MEQMDFNYPCLKINYFYDNFGKREPIFIFFAVKFREDLRKKKDLKLPPPLKSVAALPCETEGVNYTALQYS